MLAVTDILTLFLFNLWRKVMKWQHDFALAIATMHINTQHWKTEMNVSASTNLKTTSWLKMIQCALQPVLVMAMRYVVIEKLYTTDDFLFTMVSNISRALSSTICKPMIQVYRIIITHSLTKLTSAGLLWLLSRHGSCQIIRCQACVLAQNVHELLEAVQVSWVHAGCPQHGLRKPESMLLGCPQKKGGYYFFVTSQTMSSKLKSSLL